MTDNAKADERYYSRETLLYTLRGLSSFKYQNECWVKHDKYPPGVEYDDLAYTFNYFYCDSPGLSESPHDLIGSTLDDLEEVEMVKKVVNALDVVYEDYYSDVPDIEVITLPEWKDVLEAAKEAYDFFRARMEEEYSQYGQKLAPIHYLDDWF